MWLSLVLYRSPGAEGLPSFSKGKCLCAIPCERILAALDQPGLNFGERRNRLKSLCPSNYPAPVLFDYVLDLKAKNSALRRDLETISVRLFYTPRIVY